MLEEITDEALNEDLLHRQQESEQPSNLLSIFSKKKKREDDDENSPFATLFANELENMKQNRQSVRKERKEDNRMNEFVDMFSNSDPSSIATSVKLLLL